MMGRRNYGIIIGMHKQMKFRILVDTGRNPKVVRDRCSGFMRYAMEHSLPWDIRHFANWDVQNRKTYSNFISSWRPDAIYLNSPAAGYGRCLRCIPHIVAFGNPDVDWEKSKSLQRVVLVGIDDRQIAVEAFKLLARRGLSHFAYVHPSLSNESINRSQLRAETFAREAKEAGFDCAVCRQARREATNWTAAMVALAERLSALPRPCGIMAYNDQCAREVVDACHYAKLRIPEQMQVVGVDNHEDACENILPHLTSIEPDFYGAGYLAAQRIDELLTTGQAQKHSLCGVRRIAERDTTHDTSGAARLVTTAEKLIHSYACQGLPPSPKGLTVQSLAAALHVSRSLLEMRFGTVLGEGAAEAIRRQKLDEVCRLLKETDMPIGEIAYRCGFPVKTHLNALFRRTFGTTLRAYRAAENRPCNCTENEKFKHSLHVLCS